MNGIDGVPSERSKTEWPIETTGYPSGELGNTRRVRGCDPSTYAKTAP